MAKSIFAKIEGDITPHSVIAKTIHWLFVLLFIYALTKQLENVEQLENYDLLVFEVVFAAIFLAVLLIRFVYMQMTRPSAVPDSAPESVKRASTLVHKAMYVSLAMVAISGLMIGGLYSIEIKTGVFMSIAIGLHDISVQATYLTIAAHILAAVYHRLRNDGIWSSMVPIWRETTDKVDTVS